MKKQLSTTAHPYFQTFISFVNALDSYPTIKDKQSTKRLRVLPKAYEQYLKMDKSLDPKTTDYAEEAENRISSVIGEYLNTFGNAFDAKIISKIAARECVAYQDVDKFQDDLFNDIEFESAPVYVKNRYNSLEGIVDSMIK